MGAPELAQFCQLIQKTCLPGVWSKGVALARENRVRIDAFSDEEIIARVTSPDRVVSPKVSLWPEDEDSHCDCGDRVEPCAHIAAAVVAVKNGLRPGAPGAGAGSGAAADSTAGARAAEPAIRYSLVRTGNALLLERWIGASRLTDSLVSWVGGIQSGRIARPPVPATQDDFAIDRALGERRDERLDRATLQRLLPALKSIQGLTLDTQPIAIGPPTRGLHVELRDDGPGLRLVGVEDPSITEVFEGGVVLASGSLRLLEDPGLTQQERQMLAGQGRWFGPPEFPKLLSEILPALERKLPVRVLARQLPEVRPEERSAPPRVVLRMERAGEHTLSVLPRIVYPSEYATRDPEFERLLSRRVQSDLHLAVGHRTELRGMAALEFVQKTRDWETEGDGAQAFEVVPRLDPEFEAGESGFRLAFGAGPGKSADPAQVLRAWRDQELYVPLLGGGYAPLPADWLKRFAPRLQRLLALREQNEGQVPTYARPELIELAEETGGEVPDALRGLRERLASFERIPQAELPGDLRAELRHYQREGVNWLGFLRESGMGALLADDMGLGKTLQALCAIRGRTLVVTPTSVLQSWADQVRKFRPGLRLALYYGPGRRLDPDADITVTSYGLLRQDRDLLLKQSWDTAILDEAQTIRNPESQVAQAAHQLRAGFRVTLSGTPVENRMEDLWSQFQFLNPGLLGSRREFQEELAGPVTRGEPGAAQRLRARIRPFVLRRLKKDVAPELPPRTEVVLRCELAPEEQELYDALLASGRQEILDALESGESVMGALELLLRLRQACCHPGLVPGQRAATSSKLELLAQTLESTVAEGHRALVFSQWTSFLDLIGPRLVKMGLGYARLDGSTRDRDAVVREFQDPNGPPVMLISLKAGGVGLTLTAADHVFLMDSWWNPAAEDQAADRAHRIGQENPVLICRLIAQNTVEERILALQKRKQELSGAALEGSAQAASLTRDDLLALLQPGGEA